MIPIEVIIPLQGKYNKGVSNCIECNFRNPEYNVTPNIIGFAESKWGEMLVWECPICHTKQFFHYDTSYGFDYVKAFIAFKSGDPKWILKG